MEYKHNTEARTNMLKERARRCVCKYCGSPLKLHRIIFSEHEEARIEIFCSHCERIEYGVEPEVYASAKYFVDELKFNHYPDLDESETTRQMNIAKICEISNWVLKNMGLLTEDGFTTDIKMKDALIAECVLLSNQELDELDIEEW